MSDAAPEQLPKPVGRAPQPAFIPNLCHKQAVLRIVLATQLFALLVTLVHSGPGWLDWTHLALTSLFMQWIALSSAACLCAMRKRLEALPSDQQARRAYLLVLSLTLVYALLAEAIRLRIWTQGSDASWNDVDPSFVLHCVLISAIVSAVGLSYLYLQHQRFLEGQAGLEARIEALQARIKPHFLFNSMNSIAELIAVDPIKAEESVLDLAELFRAALKQESGLAPLGEEVGLCKSYLRIEGLRLGNRLQVDWRLDDSCLRLPVPPLCLQPLVENAIYHGIQPLPDGGRLQIAAYQQARSLYLEVSNPLPGNSLVPPERQHEGNRMALENTRRRLEAHYGPRAVIKTSRQEGRFTALIRIPLNQTADGSQ